MKNLLASILFTLCGALAAQNIQFTAQASNQEVAVGQTFRVTFVINSNSGSIVPPEFNGFRIAAGPLQSSSSSYINGQMSVEKSVGYELLPTKKGIFTIGSATAKVNGKTYKTEPIQITVVDASKRKKSTLEEKAAELAFVKILTNKRSVYVGEPIAARYTLVLRANVGNYELLEQPDFQGFVKNDIELKNIQTKREKINGQTETTADIAKFVLVPQQQGTYKPGKLQLRLPTQVPTGRRDFFGPEYRNVNQISASLFPTLEVKPLPIAGKPANFNGGVGQFKFNVDVSRTSVKGNESVTLTVEVSGKGNIQFIDLPEPQIPPSIESYDPKYKERFNVTTSGVKGYKRNEYLLIPRYKGTYKIPPMTFSYFDANKEVYVEVASEPFEINVTEGEEASNLPPAATPSTTDKNTVSAIGEDILFIHTTPSGFKTKSDSFFASALHKALLIGLIALTVVMLFFNRLRAQYKPDVAAQAHKRAGSAAKKQLKTAHGFLEKEDVVTFYGELSTALQHYFAHKAKLPQSAFNADNITNIVMQKGGTDALCLDIKHLLNQANMARFAPLTSTNMKNDYNLAVKCLEKLEDLL